MFVVIPPYPVVNVPFLISQQLSKSAEIKVIETKPIRGCILISKDKEIPPIQIMLFSRVRVTVQLAKDALTISSILPAVVAKQIADATVTENDSHAAAVESNADSTEPTRSSPTTSEC